MTNIKGSAIVVFSEFINSKFGAASYNAWLESLPPTTRTVLSARILVSSWFDVKEFSVDPTIKLADLCYHGDVKTCAIEMGKFSADVGLRGIYKMFVQFGTPGFLINRASSILPTYYDPCKMQVVENNKNDAMVRITYFPDMHPVVENRIVGWMLKALEISGCKNVRISIPVSLATGGATTDIKVVWD